MHRATASRALGASAGASVPAHASVAAHAAAAPVHQRFVAVQLAAAQPAAERRDSQLHRPARRVPYRGASVGEQHVQRCGGDIGVERNSGKHNRDSKQPLFRRCIIERGLSERGSQFFASNLQPSRRRRG